MRSTRTQRSASSSRVEAKGIAVSASASTIAASWERPILSSSVMHGPCRRAARTPSAAMSLGGPSDYRDLGAGFEPLAHRHLMQLRIVLAQLAAQLADQSVALGHHVVVVDRLEVLLLGLHEHVVAERLVLVHRH